MCKIQGGCQIVVVWFPSPHGCVFFEATPFLFQRDIQKEHLFFAPFSGKPSPTPSKKLGHLSPPPTLGASPVACRWEAEQICREIWQVPAEQRQITFAGGASVDGSWGGWEGEDLSIDHGGWGGGGWGRGEGGGIGGGVGGDLGEVLGGDSPSTML